MSDVPSFAEERARAAAKRHAEYQRGRARLVLRQRWNLQADELAAVITEEYPKLDTSEAAELLDAVLEVQREEQPRRLSVDQVSVRPVEMEPRQRSGGTAAEERWNEIMSDSMSMRRKPGRPRKPREEKPTMPKPVRATQDRTAPAVPRKLLGDELRAEIRRTVEAQPELLQADARRAVEARTGCAEINPGTFQLHWKRVRAEFGLPVGDERPAKKVAASAALDSARNGAGRVEEPAPTAKPTDPAESAPTPPTASSSITTVVHVDTADILEALRESGDYVRCEQRDNAWVVTAYLTFNNSGDALRVLAGFGA